MTLREASLAIETSALCEYDGRIYYAYSLVYTKNARGICIWSLVLHERRANSTIQVLLDRVKVVNWNMPDYLVEVRLKGERGS